MVEVKACNANLLKFYHDRLTFDNEQNKLPDCPLANNFATLIFSLHIASAIIESFFNKTRYTKVYIGQDLLTNFRVLHYITSATVASLS